MKNKFIIRLLLLVAVSISLYSCVHDEISSSSDPASKEYQSKSLWKEDEIYIKNVMQVYKEHEAEIQKLSGTPLWDYAMTMGYMNESFLIVPVSVNNKIVSCIQVPRYGDVIRFVYDDDPEKIKFFQAYTTAKYRKAIKQELLDNQNTKGGRECSFTSISVWLPDSPSDPDGPGHWQTNYMTNCQGSDGGGGMNDGVCSGYYDTAGNCVPLGPTYPYPGGGSGNPQQSQTPCAKTKAIVNKPQINAKLASLQQHAGTNTKVEDGFQELKSGTLLAGTVSADNQMFFGIGPNSLGTVHTHQPKSIHMFAPRDIMTFLAIIRAQDTNAVGNAYSGMVSSTGTYFINFTGTASDLPSAMTEAEEEVYVSGLVDAYELQHDYLKYLEHLSFGQKLSNIGLEKLFFHMLGQMGLTGKVELVKEENGSTSTIKLDSSGLPKPNPCQ